MQCLETKQTQANRKEQIEFRVIFQTHQSIKLILNCITNKYVSHYDTIIGEVWNAGLHFM